MVEIKIDGITCEVDEQELITLKFDGDTLTDLESASQSTTIEIKLPFSTTNAAIFGLEGDVHPQTKFNHEYHEMTIVADGITLFTAGAYLMEVVWLHVERYLVVECRSVDSMWAYLASQTLFKSIPLEYETSLNEANCKASWSSDDPVKFFPIVRDQYEDEGSSVDVTGVRLLRSLDDYHPFIELSALLEAIFEMAGYTIESSTGSQEHFDELYVSGKYFDSDSNDAAKEAMGFYLKRSEDTTTTTDTLGRVSLSPYNILNTVGNIVDLQCLESDTECYNRGNCMQFDGEAIIYRPLTQIYVGFEYYLHYTCLCSIESRSKLKGIDCLNTVSEGYINWEISNRYEDQRDKFFTNIEYKVTIFDFVDGEVYRLVGVSSTGSQTTLSTISARMSSIVLTTQYDSLMLYKYSDGVLSVDSGDWALYFGYVEQTALTEAKITFRTMPVQYSPTSPATFYLQMLQGADSAVEFTLHSDSSIRPYFSTYPSYNSTLLFEDLAQHNYVSALDLLSSVQHLFNLRFLTNESAKSVLIESFDNLYNGVLWDWSEKIIDDSEVDFIDLAHSTNRLTKYGYQQTDGVVQRMGESDNAYFGEWYAQVDSYAASSSDKTLLNPLFSASTNDDDGFLVVGDRDDVDSVDSLSFSPRIVRYLGMKEVESENSEIPYIAFHSPDDNFTLCFEDRDDVQGLNRLLSAEVELRERSQKISLSLQLNALEYSNLLEPNGVSPSIRDKFRFDIQGESFITVLHSIESYNPETGVARCTFINLN